MMSVTTDILTGFATAISGVQSDILWTPNAKNGGIAMLTMPDSPDRIAVLNLIPQSDDPVLPMGTAMVQVAARGTRGNPLDVYTILDPIFARMHGLTNQTWGSVHVTDIARYSSIPMGQDEAVRNEAIDKYTMTLDYPGTTARPATGY
jgi:hypothetical protein